MIFENTAPIEKNILLNLYKIKKYVIDTKYLFPTLKYEEHSTVNEVVNLMLSAFSEKDFCKLKNLLLTFRGVIYILSDTYPDAAYFLLNALHLSVKTEKLVNEKL